MLSLSNMTSAAGAQQYAELGDDYYMDAPDIMPNDLINPSLQQQTIGPVDAEDGGGSDIDKINPEGSDSGRQSVDDESHSPGRAMILGHDEPQSNANDGKAITPRGDEFSVSKPVSIGNSSRSNAGEDKAIYNSMWFGKAAETMGLSGQVLSDDYRKLLEGITPTGAQLGRQRGGVIERRPGIDYTFTPPKSVSIMALVAGDERVVRAHMESVLEVMKLVERDACTRVYSSGMRVPVETNNIAAALMTHTTSRTGDPNLHTHSNIVNMTMRPDGDWGSLDFTRLWEDSKGRYGEVYSTTLANKLTEIGYTISSKGKNAEFEIAGVPSSLIGIFSKRREQIKNAMAERGLEGPKSAEKANRMTRDAKSKLPYNELRSRWDIEAGNDLNTLKNIVNESINKAKENNIVDASVEAKIALELAIEHLTQREATFKAQELVSVARSIGVGKITESALNAEYNKMVSSGRIIVGTLDPTRITTNEMVSLESDNITRLELGKNTHNPIGGIEQLDRIQSKYNLNNDHIAALSIILNSSDNYVVLQGNPGVGKTVMMAAGKEIIEAQGFNIIGVSASATAAKQLQADSGISSTTLQSYLLENSKFLEQNGDKDSKVNALDSSSDSRPTVLIVDEASFVDTLRFNQLLQISNATGTRIIFSGDRKQLESVDAGKPFAQAQQYHAEKAELTKILRQKNENIKMAVYDLLERRVRPAFERSDVREVPRFGREPASQEEMVHHAVNIYFEGGVEQRDNTYLIMTTNKEVQQANREVHHRRQELGEVSRDTANMTVFKGKGLTNAEMRLPHNYQLNNVIRFNYNDKVNGITTGSYYVVSSNDIYVSGERKLLLTSQDGNKQLIISPEKFPELGGGRVEIFESKQISVGAGDLLRWRRNDLTRGMVNSEKITVMEIGNGSLKFKDESGKERSISLSDYRNRHLDYAYASTTHAVQGGKADRVISTMHSNNKLLSISLAMVQTSRAVHEHILVVDDRNKVLEKIENTKYESEAALDLFTIDKRPLDITKISDLRELVAMHGGDLRDVYISLLAEVGGDRSLAQRYLRAVGENPEIIENAILSARGALDSSKEHVANSNAKLHDESIKEVTAKLSKGDMSPIEARNLLANVGMPANEINLTLSHHLAEELLNIDPIGANQLNRNHENLVSAHDHDLDL